MTLKHIRIFIAVYHEQSVTRAAAKLGLTQPATSLAVKELEEYYHTRLFERSGRGIRPTQAGDHLYPSAVRVLSLYEEMDLAMKTWDTNGNLRIGSSISIGSCILPQLISRFTKHYPDLDVYVKVDSSDVIERGIIENRLDFALIEGNIHSDKIKSQVFLDDELIPICGRFHRLADAKDVALDDLKEERFLMREKNSGTRELTDSNFAVHGFRITPAWESTSTTALINAAAAGLGISILPKRLLEKQLRMHQIFSFTIQDIDLSRHYSLVYHENKYISPPMQSFFDMLRQTESL